MIQLLTLLQKSIAATLLDVDGAFYMTSAIEHLPFRKQRKAIIWGLFAEFVGRVVLISLLYSLLSENKTLFRLFGLKFTLDSISLFIAGAFLLFKNGRELYEFLTGQEKSQQFQFSQVSFPRLMLEMTVVNLIFSIDNIIVLSTRNLDFSSLTFIFVVSAIIRLFAIDKMAQFIHKYPSMKIVMLTFLILIGFELFLEGIWFNFPEEIFNTIMVLAIIVTIIYQRQRPQSTEQNEK